MATISPVVVSSIANACWRACKSHPIIRISASFGPSSVRVNTAQFTRAVARPASLRHQSDFLSRASKRAEGAAQLFNVLLHFRMFSSPSRIDPHYGNCGETGYKGQIGGPLLCEQHPEWIAG